MTQRFSQRFIITAMVFAFLVLACFAYSRPWYFTSQTYLGGLVFVELIVAAVWMYRRVFFPLLILSFLFAGTDVPFQSVCASARWLVLGVGAIAGLIIMRRERGYRFGLFHGMALLAALTALVSATVSYYTVVSLMKSISLLLLFMYAAVGARVATRGRENRFFAGLLVGCEFFVGILAACQILGKNLMGNPNSLGAVMGVAAAPILLWGTFVSESTLVRHRRLLLCATSLYMTFESRSRAGMLAAFVSCGLLCVALQKYKLFSMGIVIIVIMFSAAAILEPGAYSGTVSDLTSSVIFKSQESSRRFLTSRQKPWSDSVDTILAHPWFGTGFGTKKSAEGPTENVGTFSSNTTVSSEHGSSYLAIVTWVGLLGILPFFVMEFQLLKKLVQTFIWVRTTGNPFHPAVPLAVVILAGMLHAGLEDWLYAPGYYLCVFYWSMAFIFVDQVPATSLLRHYSFSASVREMHQAKVTKLRTMVPL